MVATLKGIGFTVIAGLCGFAVCILCFGRAVKRQSPYIAARCVARPKTVIYNPNPSHPCQDRGNVYLGWIPWVMTLTYSSMLSGVQGTGTRDGGLSGLMLKVNLDGIVLMRFHHLCLRVSCLAVVLYILIVLPVFKTAQCSVVGGTFDPDVCFEQNVTDYMRFTIGNVPLSKNFTVTEDSGIIGFFELKNDGVMIRLYTVVVVSWIITWYTYVLLGKEWRDILALRRVYFLEADHWSDRNIELEETLLREERENINDSVDGSDDDIESAKNYAKIRDPWVHHPEQRDTVPNVQLYSVLVGGLPSLPCEAFLQEDVKAVFSRKQSIDWQLAVTSAFFDHCVPNQPGFSSSVAAVTILPAASQLSEAWKHWYRTAAKMRRLRFIRTQIKEAKRLYNPYAFNFRARKVEDHTEIKDVKRLYRPHANNFQAERNNDGNRSDVNDSEIDDQPIDQHKSFYRKLKRKKEMIKEKRKEKKQKNRSTLVYAESDEKKKYYSEVLGNTDDLDVEKNLLHALKLGPEQTAVYSREFAQSAGKVAPYGWNESKVRHASLSELLEMEKEATLAVREASHALREARGKIAENDPDGDHCNDEDLADLMASATNSKHGDDSQEHGEVASNNQESITGDRSKLSIFGESWHKFAKKKSSLESKRSNRFTAAKRSLLQNLQFTSPTKGQLNHVLMKKLTDKKLENQNPCTPGRKTSLSKKSVTGLDDLGLEAGLFLERKKRLNGHSPQLPRTIMTRPKSAVDLSKFYEDDASSTKLNDQAHDPPRSHRRAKSNDSILELNSVCLEYDTDGMERSYFLDECDQQSERSMLTTSDHKDTDKLERERLGNESTASNDTGKDIETSAASFTSPIWDKLAMENDRRNEIRKRLDSISSHSSLRSDPDEKSIEAKKISFSEEKATVTTLYDNEATVTTNEKSNNIQKADNISHRRVTDTRMYSIDESESDAVSAKTRTGSRDFLSPMADQGTRLTFAFEEKAGLRRRQSDTSVDRFSKRKDEKWSKVVQIANESSSRRKKNDGVKSIEGGSFQIFSFRSIYDRIVIVLKNAFNLKKWRNHSADIRDPFDLAGESTFAVVTFTSRQAAVAARHCLADSRGADRWNTVSEIPSPPLADAPVCNLSNLAGLCRPVTISINDRQKMLRHILALAMLGAIYICFVTPLALVQQLLSPASLVGILPQLDTWLQNDLAEVIFSGWIPALIWTIFYSICPPIFKAIANFGSNATSAAVAEGTALRYFWYFMILSGLTTTSLLSAGIEGIEVADGGGLDFAFTHSFKAALLSAAGAVPTTVSALWLNWIIVRASIVLPAQYTLQWHIFVLSWFRLKPCARSAQGGGSGGAIPFRIYVDSGVVMTCLLALAPASPLIAIAVFFYFLFSVPMLRWILIFLHKPKFDIGGARFPFIFDMCISGMVLGQLLLGTMLLIRKAFGPAVLAFIPLIPTIFYRWILLNRYLKAFSDVALLQTSLLDGWDTNEVSYALKREEFRQFLVDCHKAAYVPVCIASEEATVITCEPAVVVHLETDADEDCDDSTSYNTEPYSVHEADTESLHGMTRPSDQSKLYHPYQPQNQPGRMMRRANSFSHYDDNLPMPIDHSPRKRKLSFTKQII